MRGFVNIIFYIGFIFFGVGFLYSFVLFIGYNGLGNIFEYRTADSFEIQCNSTTMPVHFVYNYVVNKEQYQGSHKVGRRTLATADLSSLNVLYNSVFKNLSMVDGFIDLDKKKPKSWGYLIGMIIYIIPLLIITLIYLFADIDKWIGMYTRGEIKSSHTK